LSQIPSPLDTDRAWLVKNLLFLSFAKLAERLIAIVGSIYVRRVFAAVVIGQVSWTAAVMSYFALLGDPGLSTIAKREVARNHSLAVSYVCQMIILRSILAVCGFSLVWLTSRYVLQREEIKVLLLLQSIGLLLFPLDFTWLLHAHGRMASLAVANVGIAIFQTSAYFYFIREPVHVYRYVLLSYPFQLALVAFTIIYGVRCQLLGWKTLRCNLDRAGALIRLAIPVGLSQATILIYYSCDAIILGLFHGDKAVGLYSTAYSVMLIPASLVGMSVLNAYFPLLARSALDFDQAKRVSKEFLHLMTWSGFAFSCLGWAVGRHLIVLLYGKAFEGSGPVFEWLSLNVALVFFNVGYNQPLNSWHHQSLVLRCTIVGALTNLGLNIALIPIWGINGAIVTTILAELAVMFMGIFVRRNVHPLSWHKPLFQAGGMGILAGGLARVMITFIPWWLAVFMGLLVFLLGLAVFERQNLFRVNRVLRNYFQL
jgi:O-antigen/teichoic acid export membrane protein